jgi:hypothetical protein
MHIKAWPQLHGTLAYHSWMSKCCRILDRLHLPLVSKETQTKLLASMRANTFSNWYSTNTNQRTIAIIWNWNAHTPRNQNWVIEGRVVEQLHIQIAHISNKKELTVIVAPYKIGVWCNLSIIVQNMGIQYGPLLCRAYTVKFVDYCNGTIRHAQRGKCNCMLYWPTSDAP